MTTRRPLSPSTDRVRQVLVRSRCALRHRIDSTPGRAKAGRRRAAPPTPRPSPGCVTEYLGFRSGTRAAHDLITARGKLEWPGSRPEKVHLARRRRVEPVREHEVANHRALTVSGVHGILIGLHRVARLEGDASPWAIRPE